ncbi:CYTH domain-containing protein [Glaciihabitans sp. UYNi722]|uniref:CYTH domain-containing protein n=1 Tax=Glaciihabitans sp. UYNi722 TaxID=3156344 RepID=UPI003396F23A
MKAVHKMPIEVERKFLTKSASWRLEVVSESRIVQGYLRADAQGSVRTRVADEGAWLTIKGPSSGMARLEFEYAIPPDEASQMIELLASGIVEKVRYRLSNAPGIWTVDVFGGANQGLVLLEIEGELVGNIANLPDWVGEEVTTDPRYYNSELSNRPFSTWVA